MWISNSAYREPLWSFIVVNSRSWFARVEYPHFARLFELSISVAGNTHVWSQAHNNSWYVLSYAFFQIKIVFFELICGW